MPATDNKLIHVQAVNLARRWTVQNENDLVQEDMYGNSMDIGHSMDIDNKREYDYHACQELASHMLHAKALPAACARFEDITSELKRRDTDTTHPTQYLS